MPDGEAVVEGELGDLVRRPGDHDDVVVVDLVSDRRRRRPTRPPSTRTSGCSTVLHLVAGPADQLRPRSHPEPVEAVAAGRSAPRGSRACCPRSGGVCSGTRAGSSRGPSTRQITTVPTRSGSPTRAKEKNGNGPAPASCDASETITLTGLLISSSSPPAAAREGDRHEQLRRRPADPLGEQDHERQQRRDRAVEGDQRRRAAPTAGTPRPGPGRAPLPARSISARPAQVVTPVESMPSLTTNNVAMKMTTGSPNPATASFVVTRPVAHSPSARQDRHDTDRQTVPDEQDHDDAEDDERLGGVIHGPARLEMDGRAGPPGDPDHVPDARRTGSRSRARRPCRGSSSTPPCPSRSSRGSAGRPG